MPRIIKLSGNDACDAGIVQVTYSHGAHSPLGFMFTPKKGNPIRFSIHAGNVRELARFLVENL